MTQDNKKHLYDETGNIMALDKTMPSKYNVAVEELKTCLGCMDSVGRCAFNLEYNLTDNDLSARLVQLDSMINELNQLFRQHILKEKELDTRKLELENLANKFGSGGKIGYKLGYLGSVIAGFVIGIIAYAV